LPSHHQNQNKADREETIKVKAETIKVKADGRQTDELTRQLTSESISSTDFWSQWS